MFFPFASEEIWKAYMEYVGQVSWPRQWTVLALKFELPCT